MRHYARGLAAALLIAGACTAGAAAASAATADPPDTAPSAVDLTLSSPSVEYGDEEAETITVTVTGAGDTPTGTATVTVGVTTVCTIALVGGTGTCAPAADEFAVGTVVLSAAYGGDANYDSSASLTASLQVTTPPPPPPSATTTSLGLSKAGIFYGDEQTETLSVKVVASDNAVPDGSVAVGYGTTTLCAFSLSSSGTGACTLKPTVLPPGRVTLTASYAGGTTFAGSKSALATLTVGKEPTATAAALSASKVTYGAEQHERITVAVKPAYAGTPTGHVTVKAGSTTIRVITLASGKGSYTLAASALAAGAPKITLTYTADGRFAASASAVKLSVRRASSETALGLSASKVTYGAEQHERITVAVKPAYAGTPTGHVTVKAGSTAICVIPLKSARGACYPSAAGLSIGNHKITAVYGGSTDVVASASAARTFSVVKASSATGLSLSAAKVQYGSETSEKVSVRVAPQYAGTPGGTVTVKANGSTVAVIKLKSGAGSYALSAKRFAGGAYKLVASYAGNADFNGSTSAKKTLTVTSPPPPPPACHPLSSKGTCYEPGEFCPNADHGETGVAGDGKAIICENNDGWRWEPLD